MLTRLFFALGATFLVLVTPTTATFWRLPTGYKYKYVYPQQGVVQLHIPIRPTVKPGYSPNNHWMIPGGIVVPDNTEWVCKSPRTGDMMIIAAEDSPKHNGNNGQGQQPHYPRPPTQNQPHYPHSSPNYPIHQSPCESHCQQQPMPQQPNQGPSQPHYQPQPMSQQPNQGPSIPQYLPQPDPYQPHYQPQSEPYEPNEETPNTNGEGVIDIRLGDIK